MELLYLQTFCVLAVSANTVVKMTMELSLNSNGVLCTSKQNRGRKHSLYSNTNILLRFEI